MLAGISTPTGSAPTHVVRRPMRTTPVVDHTWPAIAPSITLPGKVSSPVNGQRFAYSYILQSGIFSR